MYGIESDVCDACLVRHGGLPMNEAQRVAELQEEIDHLLYGLPGRTER